jgi:hypothetical protein
MTNEAWDDIPLIPNKNSFQFTRVGDLKYRKPAWVIDGLVETETLGLLFGEPGCGKSFLAVDMALCVATGVPFHEKPVKQGAVFYIAGEGFNGLTRRFRAWAKHKNVDIDGAGLFVSQKAAQFLDAASAVAVTEAVRVLAAEHGIPAMIFIDTIARNFGAGDENSTSEMGKFIAAMDALKAEFPGCSVFLVHHTGHSEKQRARGSIALKGALDAEYRLDKSEDTMTLSNTKMKDGEPPAAIAFNLESIDLDDGSSSAVLIATEVRHNTKTLSADQKLAMNAFCEAAHKSWDDEGEFDGLSLQPWREEYYALHASDKQDTKRQAFGRAVKALVSEGRIKVENGSYMLTDSADMLHILERRSGRQKAAAYNFTKPTEPRYGDQDKVDTVAPDVRDEA